MIVDQYLADEVARQCGRISRQLGSAQPSKGPDVLHVVAARLKLQGDGLVSALRHVSIFDVLQMHAFAIHGSGPRSFEYHRLKVRCHFAAEDRDEGSDPPQTSNTTAIAMPPYIRL